MRQGIYHYFGYDYGFEKRTQLIAEAGFDSTMLWWGDEDFIPLTKKEQVACIRQAGLAIENVHAPYDQISGLWARDFRTVKSARESYLRYIEECATYRIPMMVIHGLPQEPIEDDQNGFYSFRFLLEQANRLGVALAVENTIEDARFERLLEEGISQGLKWCYDSSHDWVYSRKPTAILEKHAHALACLHLSDNDGLQDRHWLPGEGDVAFHAIERILRQSDFQGHWSLEVFPQELNEPAEAFLKRAKKRLDWVMEGAKNGIEI